MFERFDEDARRAVMSAAQDEARRRGDRRIGTDHLLLALLRDSESVPVRTLGVDLAAARAAADALDRAALASIGIDVSEGGRTAPVPPTGRAPLTSGARAILGRSIEEARRANSRRIRPRHMLLALLTRQRPDPAADLLDALGVDRAAARSRLASSTG